MTALWGRVGSVEGLLKTVIDLGYASGPRRALGRPLARRS